MEQFFLDLQPAIETAAGDAMEKIRREIGEEHIYGAALVTDSDCVTLFLAVNTEEALSRRDRADRKPKRLAMLRKYWPKELVDQVAEGSFSLKRYIPDEWDYSDGTGSELNQISQRLWAQVEALANGGACDGVLEQFRTRFLETVTLAFEALRARGVFGPEILCFVSMSDDERTPDIEDASARRLNTPGQYAQFQTWKGAFNR